MRLPPYDNFPNLFDDKVSLREIKSSDTGQLIEISFYDSVQATTLQEAEEMQIKIKQDYVNGCSIHWGIIDNVTNEVVGTCGFYRGLEDGEGELGCILLPRFYRKGFMTAAILLAIDFGTNIMGLSRIWAATSLQNVRAIKLLERLGFVAIKYLNNKEVVYELKRKV